MGPEADAAVDCSKSEQSVVCERSCGGHLVVAHQFSNGNVRNQFDQLAEGYRRDRPECLRRRLLSSTGDMELVLLGTEDTTNSTQMWRDFTESSLPPARPFSAHRSSMVRRRRDETESHADNVTAHTRRRVVCGETSDTRSRRSCACPPLWPQPRFDQQ